MFCNIGKDYPLSLIVWQFQTIRFIQMMFDLWPVYSGERFRASWPSCFKFWTELCPWLEFELQPGKLIFIEPTCSEQDIVVIISVQCMCVHWDCVHLSGFVLAITSTFMHEFQNNLAELYFLTNRSAIWNICSGKLKVKVTLEGQMIKCS